jgi:hypothetical protein
VWLFDQEAPEFLDGRDIFLKELAEEIFVKNSSVSRHSGGKIWTTGYFLDGTSGTGSSGVSRPSPPPRVSWNNP